MRRRRNLKGGQTRSCVNPIRLLGLHSVDAESRSAGVSFDVHTIETDCVTRCDEASLLLSATQTNDSLNSSIHFSVYFSLFFSFHYIFLGDGASDGTSKN